MVAFAVFARPRAVNRLHRLRADIERWTLSSKFSSSRLPRCAGPRQERHGNRMAKRRGPPRLPCPVAQPVCCPPGVEGVPPKALGTSGSVRTKRRVDVALASACERDHVERACWCTCVPCQTARTLDLCAGASRLLAKSDGRGTQHDRSDLYSSAESPALVRPSQSTGPTVEFGWGLVLLVAGQSSPPPSLVSLCCLEKRKTAEYGPLRRGVMRVVMLQGSA